MFTIQKTKVWNFLLWLNTHNRLYTDISLDRMTMDTYPENGLLPSIEDQIFEDHLSNPLDVFAEEAASFAEHPAQMMIDRGHQSDPDKPCL